MPKTNKRTTTTPVSRLVTWPVALVFVFCLFLVPATSQSCGKRDAGLALVGAMQADHAATYIVGGTRALAGEFPWQASLQVMTSRRPVRWTHNCGGSVISRNWIVTAGHCIITRNTRLYRVVVGSLTHNSAGRGAQTLRVRSVVLHPEFSESPLTDDIALLELASSIKFDGKLVAPVCLPAKGAAFTGEKCIASGWGRTRERGPASKDLLKVDLPIIQNNLCARRYRNVRGARVTRENICAGSAVSSGKGVCQGDSGGPLVCRQSDGSYALAGVTSYGVICGSSQHPPVFTRVSEYSGWIKKVMKK